VQKALVDEYKENYIKEQLKLTKEEAIRQGLYNEFFHEMAELRHALGRPILNIFSNIENIKTAIDKAYNQRKVLSLNDNLSDNIPISVNKIFHYMKTDLEQITKLLESAQYYLEVDKYELSSVDIVMFMNEYVAKVRTNYAEDFNLIVDNAPKEIDLKRVNQIYLKGNNDLLHLLFDSIIDNAKKHGFNNIVSSNNPNEVVVKIGTEVRADTSYFIVRVMNNGTAFPKNFDKKKFITKSKSAGEKANSGIGGYHVDKIVNYLNGEFEIVTKETGEYKVEFKFKFPIVGFIDE
jgi:type I restriction enzyme M protein